MSDALIVRDDGKLTITFTPTAEAAKVEALEASALIARVTDAAENQTAVEAQAKLTGLKRQVEKARKAAKEPVLAFGSRIDAAARQFVEDISAEELRVTTLIADFQQLEQSKARAEEQRRKLEAELLEKQRLEELRRLAEEQEAGRRKIAEAEAEQRRKAQEAKTAAARAEAEALQKQIDEQKAKAEAQSHEQLDAITERYAVEHQQLQSAPTYQPAKASGQSAKADWDVTVTDIHLLYRHHPNCVKLEPLIGEIKNLLKGGTTPKGVSAKPIVKSIVRTAQAVAIDV